MQCAQHARGFRTYAESGWWDGVPHRGSALSTAARPSPLGCDSVCLRLELVPKGLEHGRIAAGYVSESLPEQPVCEPGISRKQRAVEVRPERPPQTATFEAGLAVVSKPVHDAAKRLGAWIEGRSSCVVLEARDRPPYARLELALEEDVTDHARRPGSRLVREELRSGHEDPVPAPVAPP